MTEEWYFVISCDEDGHSIYMMSGEQLEENLNPEDEDDAYMDGKNFIGSKEIIEKWRNSGHPIELNHFVGYYSGGNIMIIKGKIVTPRPKEKVTRYEVD